MKHIRGIILTACMLLLLWLPVMAKATPKLSNTSLTITQGKTVKVKLKNAKAGQVKWSSSNKKVATVSKGRIKTKKAGKTTIIARYQNRKYKCRVVVVKKDMKLVMTVDGEKISVKWEDNKSTNALKKLAGDEPLTIQMSKYGGFEQVGSIGKSISRNNKQTTTSPGDIMLYAGDQIVIFYGSNSWAYTKLGKITDKTDQELRELLGKEDVTIKIYCE